MSTVIVIAKAPVPGRVKTRLTPPCTPDQAAALAEAALSDTLTAVARSSATRRVVALDGDAGDWMPEGFEVIAQRGEGLAERLAAAFASTGGPAFLVGMDTPQITPGLIDAGLAEPCSLGLAVDGGYWAIGLPAPDDRVFARLPMSTERTGARQRARLHELGYAPVLLPELTDVDTIADAHAVAALAPHTRFAHALASLRAEAAA